jgi:hypothetical protein
MNDVVRQGYVAIAAACAGNSRQATIADASRD